MHGVIKKLVLDRGFGFVRDKDSRDEYFLHANTNPEFFVTTFEGETVTFDGEPTVKGLRVTSIQRA